MVIFYSIINYEHNQLKFKHEKKASRELLTFTTASKMHENELMNNFKVIREFYAENSQLFLESRWNEIDALWKSSPNKRFSFIIIFNYFESISIGLEQDIMDETFMKEFFKTVFRDYLLKYGTYLDYERITHRSDRIYQSFTRIATKWKSDN